MIYLIVAVPILGLLYWYLFRYRKQLLFRRMAAAVDLVKMGLYLRLLQRYGRTRGEQEAVYLAAAVTNELFSEAPSNAGGDEYLRTHKQVVDIEIRNLQDDYEARRMVTQAVRVMSVIAHACGVRSRENLIEPLEKLKDLGVLTAGSAPPSPGSFLSEARSYYHEARLPTHATTQPPVSSASGPE